MQCVTAEGFNCRCECHDGPAVNLAKRQQDFELAERRARFLLDVYMISQSDFARYVDEKEAAKILAAFLVDKD